MAQINIKQIRGASQGSLIFLGTNSVLSENYNRLNWNQNTNQFYLNGQIKIQDGNQASGYVLTSDNDGLASWAIPIVNGASNGVSLEGNNVVLGGTMSQSTIINGSQYDLYFQNFDNLYFTSSVFDVETSLISLDAGTGSVQILANDGISLMSVNAYLLLSAQSGDVSIGNGEGLVYTSDYSGTFVTNSLITKKYVDSLGIATGSGTTNYYPKWNTTNNLSSTSSIYDNDGKIGIGLTSADSTLHIKGNTYSTVFKVDGTSGELFSVNDSLNGSLFSVNDISGLPVLEVFSDNTVSLGEFQARSLYTTKKTNVIPGTNTIYSFATASYDGAFIDYTAFDGTNARSGSLTAIWMGNQIEFTEISSKDLGDTKSLTFSFVLSGTYAVYGVDASSNWTVKSLIRSI